MQPEPPPESHDPGDDASITSPDEPSVDREPVPESTAPAMPAGHVMIPFARPVSDQLRRVVTLQYAPPGSPVASVLVLPDISERRALLEILAVMAATFAGGICFPAALGILLRTDDPRSISIPSTAGVGATALAVCLALLWERGLSVRTIGWTFRHFWLNIAIGVGGYLASRIALIVLAVGLYLLSPSSIEQGDAQTREALNSVFPDMSPAVVVLFMTFVVIWEEVAFRGFLLTRLQVVLRRWWLTVPVGALLFGMGHVWQGPMAAMMTAVLGVVLGVLFAWRKSLVPGMVLHLINNLLAIWLLKSVYG